MLVSPCQSSLHLFPNPTGIKRRHPEGVGSARAERIEQSERRPERLSRIVGREPRPTRLDPLCQIPIHPGAEMGAVVPGVILPAFACSVIPLEHRQELGLTVPI